LKDHETSFNLRKSIGCTLLKYERERFFGNRSYLIYHIICAFRKENNTLPYFCTKNVCKLMIEISYWKYDFFFEWNENKESTHKNPAHCERDSLFVKNNMKILIRWCRSGSCRSDREKLYLKCKSLTSEILWVLRPYSNICLCL